MLGLALTVLKPLHEHYKDEWFITRFSFYYLDAKATAESALDWGIHQHWQLVKENKFNFEWLCKQSPSNKLRSCLLPYSKTKHLLIGQARVKIWDEDVFIYQWVESKYENNKLILKPIKHGWIDYCPLSNEKQCAAGSQNVKQRTGLFSY